MKYAIFKYVPNIRRMEPRNIGLLLCDKSRVWLQFLGENGSEEPKFVNNLPIYHQWVKFWKKEVDQEKNNEDLITLLTHWNKGSFYIQESGRIIDLVSDEDLPLIGIDLFEKLVR